jgi:hypothetical protein
MESAQNASARSLIPQTGPFLEPEHYCMPRFALFVLVMIWLASSRVIFAAAASPNWFDRAPLNTDTEIVGLPWFGLGRAYRYFAFILNLAALAGICYVLGKHEMEWSNFLYVFVGIVVGSFLLSILLNPLLHIFTLVPIVALTTFLLTRFCLLRVSRALMVTLLYHLYQIGYLITYKAIAGRYA